MPADSAPVLPREFYRGRSRAWRVVVAAVLVVAASFGSLVAAGFVNPAGLFGPHVQRSEWAFTMSGVRELNARGLTGLGVTVCIVDSGIDLLHPDFGHVRLVAWRDFVNLRPGPYDDSGHGTAMAGLIVANGSLRGAAPDAGLIVAKVVNAAGDGSDQNVAGGIRFCVDPWGDGRKGADIVSLSLGSKARAIYLSAVVAAVAWATSQGVFVVGAAGNDGLFDDGDVELPASVPLAIAVGAVDMDGVKAPFTSIGSSVNRTDPNLKPEVVAPGIRLISTTPGARYETITGTSPATALVAGVLALLLQGKPNLRPGGVAGNILVLKSALAASSRKAAAQEIPHDPWYGYGIADGLATLALL